MENYFLMFIGWKIMHMDEFIDALLHEEYFLEIGLPRIPERYHLEMSKTILPRRSVLEEDNTNNKTIINDK